MDIGTGLVAIGAGIAVLTGLGSGIGQGYAAGQACDAVGKNPEAQNEIRTMLILGAGIAETAGIYGLLIAFLLIFVYA